MIWRVLSRPRFRLATLPTPLERAQNLGRDLGVELLIKRDDVMELALGGNKVRKLEFIVADALARGADVLVTGGAMHSNHARLTAAAAMKAGLEAHLVLRPPGGGEIPQGNLLLDHLLGAGITYIEGGEDLDEAMERVVRDLRARGRRPYTIPAGGASEYGVLGYALAAIEILQQASAMGLRPGWVVHTTGTGATQAGLVLGMKILGAEGVRVVGISNGRKASELVSRIHGLVERASSAFGLGVRVSPEDVIVYDSYTFGGYGAISKEVVETMKYAARREGIILDPVYTAKGFYGLIDLVERGEIKKGETVVFIHTGGTPIVFQYAEALAKHL